MLLHLQKIFNHAEDEEFKSIRSSLKEDSPCFPITLLGKIFQREVYKNLPSSDMKYTTSNPNFNLETAKKAEEHLERMFSRIFNPV